MANYTDRFLDKENFYLAFKKLEHYLSGCNEWYDPLELAAYEAMLPGHIQRITELLSDETYIPKEIELLPFPKSSKGDQQRVRPYYRVSLDDQLIWIAIINIIGEKLEEKMPFWNYGNRLYRPTWYDMSEGVKELKIGSYRHTSAYLYRTWPQSWPRYRRHMSMTVKTMGYNRRFSQDQLEDSKEVDLLNQERDDKWKNFYLNKDFWPHKRTHYLCWAGLDFKAFFPSVNAGKVISIIEKSLEERNDVTLIINTIKRMLKFPIAETEGNTRLVKAFGLPDSQLFSGLPTGLFASGFLANVAMIEVDEQVTAWVRRYKNVAVFKYVDDHVVVANSQRALTSFLNFYHELLNKSETGAEFQEDKTEPETAISYTPSKGFSIKAGCDDEIILDVNYPEPLMTHTISKMSNLNDEDYELSSTEELEAEQTDLEHFLIADFSDSEIKRETRMAFAAMKLCHLAKHIKPDFNKINITGDYVRRPILDAYEKESGRTQDKFTKADHKKLLERLKRQVALNLKAETNIVRQKHTRIFNLLIKAVRENPDKIKLWRRSLEFCYATGLNKLDVIFSEIRNINLHSESKNYLYGYCLVITQNLLLKAANDIDSPQCSYWQCQTSNMFLMGLKRPRVQKLIESFVDDKNVYPFVRHSLRVYRLALVHSLSHFNSISSTEKQHDQAVVDLKKRWGIQSLWYILQNVSEERKVKYWNSHIDQVTLTHPLSWSVFSLYPEFISTSVFKEIHDFIQSAEIPNNLKFSEMSNFSQYGGFLYEIFNTNKELKGNIDRYPFDTLKLVFSRNRDEYLPLDEWLDKVVENGKGKNWVEPQLFEWSLLEIVRQIASAIQHELKKVNEDIFARNDIPYIIKVHPANYLLPLVWLNSDEKKQSWESWKKSVRDKPIELAPKDSLLEDFRFIPIRNYWQVGYGWIWGQIEIPVVIGLSVLLTKLLAKSFKWPSTANKLKFIDQLFSRTLHNIETEPISSDTRKLLEAIFSKREIDVFYTLETKIELSPEKYIRNLSDFINCIEAIQSKLEQLQVRVMEHNPRQLAYVSIDDLNLNSSSFFEKL